MKTEHKKSNKSKFNTAIANYLKLERTQDERSGFIEGYGQCQLDSENELLITEAHQSSESDAVEFVEWVERSVKTMIFNSKENIFKDMQSLPEFNMFPGLYLQFLKSKNKQNE